MKCSNCGSELSDDTKFCSYCGIKIEKTVSISSMENIATFEGINNESKRTNTEKSKVKKSVADKIKEKGVGAWNKLSTYGKITIIVITVFAFLCFVAFLFGKTFAVIIAILQIVLTIIALLMKKQIIKVPKNWLYIMTLALAIILLIPYICLFRVDYENVKRLKWSDVVLSDIVPEPESRFGKVLSNSRDELSLDVYRINQVQYDDYIEKCKERGFTVDSEQLEDSFAAYDNSGYKLSLYYYENDSKMHIDVSAAYQYGTFVWPDSVLANMLPIPKSTIGEISKDDETGFLAYVSNTPIDDFKTYVTLCVDKGFTVDSHETEKSYSAKNSEGYRLSVEYQGNNVICIVIDEPEYEVVIEVGCVANWFFSKYDVDIYISDLLEGTISHGTSETFTVALKKGIYEIKFVNAEDSSVNGKIMLEVTSKTGVEYKIYCHADEITIDTEYLDREEVLAENEVKVMSSESDYLYKNYKEVEKELTELGFINVKTVPVYDIFFGITEAESVSDVSINGSTSFKRGDVFLNSVDVIIKYHMPEEDNPEKQITEEETRENDSDKEASGTHNEQTQNQITATYDQDAEVLDENDAWIAVEDYGRNMYLKFKLHYYTGKLLAEQVDDNTWNLKALCDVDMGNGTIKNCNCEATVEGTNLDAKVTYFIVY